MVFDFLVARLDFVHECVEVRLVDGQDGEEV